MNDQRKRCAWCESGNADYIDYHDTEWGVPVVDDRTQFEFLLLESAQAGLSWSTVLNKRAGYRRHFADFDAARVARFTPRQVERILLDPAIIRNRQKVEAAIVNARCFLDVQQDFGTFCRYIWGFVDGRPQQFRRRSMKSVPATSKISDRLSKDLKQRGFKFVGSTIMYAHMQAVGMVNDHVTSCWRHEPCRQLGENFTLP